MDASQRQASHRARRQSHRHSSSSKDLSISSDDKLTALGAKFHDNKRSCGKKLSKSKKPSAMTLLLVLRTQNLLIETKKECSLLGSKDHGLVHSIMSRSTSMTQIIAIYPFSDLIRDEHWSFDGAEIRCVNDAPGLVPSAPFYENSF